MDTCALISIPNLEEILQDFHVNDNMNLHSLNMGKLVTVGGDFVVRNNMQDPDYQKPEQCERDEDCPELPPVMSFGSLVSVHGDFKIDNNKKLESVDFGSLAEVLTDFHIVNNENLKSIKFDTLHTGKRNMITIHKYNYYILVL